jgi:hypothetical protein
VLLAGVVSAIVIVSSISSGGNSVFVVGIAVGTVIVQVVRLLEVIVLEVRVGMAVGVLVVSSLLCTL